MTDYQIPEYEITTVINRNFSVISQTIGMTISTLLSLGFWSLLSQGSGLIQLSVASFTFGSLILLAVSNFKESISNDCTLILVDSSFLAILSGVLFIGYAALEYAVVGDILHESFHQVTEYLGIALGFSGSYLFSTALVLILFISNRVRRELKEIEYKRKLE